MKSLIACLLIGAAVSAPAGIVWFAGQDIPIPTTFEGVSVDLETGATSTNFEGLPGGDANFVLGGRGITNDADRTASAPTWQFIRLGTDNISPARNLSIGDSVDATSSSFATGFGGSGEPNSHFPEFTSGDSGYIGFSLTLDSSDEVYGWMRVSLKSDNTGGGMIHEWAYEDSGSAITVGAIPEPTSILLAFLGFGSLLLRRQR
jgi:hypothetical protein